MVLSTVGVNLKDCAPFSSLPSVDLTAPDQAEFDKIFSEAGQAQQKSQFDKATVKLEQAARLDPLWAELQFRWGQCLLGQSNAASARIHFEQARDDDALPFRTDTRLNEIIKRTASQFAGRDFALCDAVSLFATNSPGGIPGDEFFYEHVHLNFAGNYLLARALAEDVVPMLPGRVTRKSTPSWASEETCEHDLGLTDWNRRDVFEEVWRRLRQAPFIGRPDNIQNQRAWQAKLAELQPHLNPTNVASAKKIYLESIARWPDDFRLHWNYADFLEATRERAEAVAEWKKVQALIPQHHLAYYEIGRLLAQLGQNEEARGWLTRAIGLRPDLSEGWYELGRIQAANGEFETALQSFDHARVLVPAEPRYHCELGKTLIKLNRTAAAMAQLGEAVQLGKDYWEAHYLLGEQLAFAGEIPLARREFEETIRIKPGYPMAHFNLGVALAKQGNLDEARSQFQEVLRLDPRNQQAAAFLQKLSSKANP
jgi:tetratricopeptide (TPR) repeat protein